MNKRNRASALQTTLATSALILLPSAAQAVEVSMSGQVNRVIMNIDNGVDSGVVHADNSVSGTRWRFKGDGELDNGMTTGLVYETQLQSNPSDAITAEDLDHFDDNGGNLGGGNYFSTRLSYVWLKGNFGKVAMGQNSGAADGSAEVDDSGTTVIQYSGSSADLLGAMVYGNTDVTVGETRTNFDGLSRYDNLRYDAGIQNFTLAASLGNGEKYGLSARYVIDNFKFMIGTWDENDANTGLAGSSMSASWVADNGFNLTGAYGSDDREGDPENFYFKVGYIMGDHAFGIDWGETTDLAPGDASSYSIAWVGSMMKGVEFYASYRVESLDAAGADDIEALAGGARIKF